MQGRFSSVVKQALPVERRPFVEAIGVRWSRSPVCRQQKGDETSPGGLYLEMDWDLFCVPMPV
jgi:hypothetical protein